MIGDEGTREITADEVALEGGAAFAVAEVAFEGGSGAVEEEEEEEGMVGGGKRNNILPPQKNTQGSIAQQAKNPSHPIPVMPFSTKFEPTYSITTYPLSPPHLHPSPSPCFSFSPF